MKREKYHFGLSSLNYALDDPIRILATHIS